MGPHLLALGLILSAPAQGADSQRAFASAATEALIRHAMVRHAAADTTVHDYKATFRTRLTFAIGRRMWARIPPIAAEEQTGVIRWQRPNDMQIEMVGRRNRARNPDMQIESMMDSPWFVPRALDDSVRVAGADFPATAALHPLAGDGPDWYAYALTDSLAVRAQDGRMVNLYRVQVTPRRTGKGLVVGYLLLDGATGDVVRFSFQFVGTDLWVAPDGTTKEDSSDARTANTWINRLVTLNADLEYSLQDRTHWMPFRQTISGSVQIPFVGDAVIPFSFSTTFDDYEIDTGIPIVFRAPAVHSKAEADSLQAQRWDSIQAARQERRERGEKNEPDSSMWRHLAHDVPGVMTGGGRFEIHQPPRDSIDHYAGWSDSLLLDSPDDGGKAERDLQAELAGLAERLPDQFTGRHRATIAVEQLADAFRYNRVQGMSLGLGYKMPFFHVPFTTANVTGRYGFSDTRLYARGALIRTSPTGRWTLAGYRDLGVQDPFFQPKILANSMNALFTGHDEADYYLAEGVSLLHENSLGVGVDLAISARFERERSVGAEAKSAINNIWSDGFFDPNPAIAQGDFVGATARLDGRTGRGRWMLGADVLSGSPGTVGRLVGEWKQRVNAGKSGLSLAARSGVATSTDLPQSQFRLGGEATVRGFPYGAFHGQAFWAVQADLGVGRGAVRPVLFADAGQAGPAASLTARQVIAGGGVGVSFFGGIGRIDLSLPFTPSGGDPRIDLVFVAAR